MNLGGGGARTEESEELCVKCHGLDIDRLTEKSGQGERGGRGEKSEVEKTRCLSFAVDD